MIRLFRFYQIEILPYVDVVICADGIRNTPRTDVLLEVKRKLLQTFATDIEILGTQEQADIYQAQWKEIIYNYLKEKNIVQLSLLLKRIFQRLPLGRGIYLMLYCLVSLVSFHLL